MDKLFKFIFKNETKVKKEPVKNDEAKVKLLDDTSNAEEENNPSCSALEPSDLELELPKLRTEFDEIDDKAEMIQQVLNLQNTLDELVKKTSNVREDNRTLKYENELLTNYLQNLMSASSVFEPLKE